MLSAGDGEGDDDDDDDDHVDDHNGRVETTKGARRERCRQRASEDGTLGVSRHLNCLYILLMAAWLWWTLSVVSQRRRLGVDRGS